MGMLLNPFWFSGGGDISPGVAEIFNSASTSFISITEMDSTHAIVCYQDVGSGDEGKAVCLSLSGTTITAGTEVQFSIDAIEINSVTMMDSTHAIVTYRDEELNPDEGKAVCLSLSGTTITAGTEFTFNSYYTQSISVTAMDSTHAIVAYSSSLTAYFGYARCLVLTGTTITAGTEVVWSDSTASQTSSTRMDSTHAIVCRRQSDKGKAVCLSLSGTTITVGTELEFSSTNIATNSVCTMDSTHAIVCYNDASYDSGYAICLSLSGTTITAGTKEEFITTAAGAISATSFSSTQAIVCFADTATSNHGTSKLLTLSGTDITSGNAVVYNDDGATYYNAVATMSSTHAIVAYQNVGNSNYGTAKCLEIEVT